MMKDDGKTQEKKHGASALTIALFAAAMVFFSLLGLILPLRPSVSVEEKRELTKFPAPSVETVMDGGFFSQLSLWYSDSYPYRDTWLALNNRLEGLYGIRTTQIIQGSHGKDEIPDVIPDPTGSEEQSSEIETTAEETETETDNTEAEPTASNTPETLAPITAQTQNGLFVHDDTAYGIYYFNKTAADLYTEAVNRVTSELKGISQVYTMIVPISSSMYLNEETLKSTDGSDEKRALEYYYGSLSADVSQLQVYDILSEHNAEYIYFRTDHHWTARGAYYGYRKWAEAKGVAPHELSEYVTEQYPGFLGTYYASCNSPQMAANPDTVEVFRPLTVSTMTFTQTDGVQLNWPIVNTVSSYTTFAGSDNPFSVIHNETVQNGQSCVIIKDSYANALIPFLADHYETIYWFDYRTYNGDITSFIRDNNITDVMFVTGDEPITSIEAMQRMSALLP